MGNSYLCYCKKSNIIEEKNVLKVEGKVTTQKIIKKDNNVKKKKKKI
jgi:hypothetical protein